MLKYSTQFQQALHRTFILAATMSVMIFLWSCGHLPEDNLLITVFAFLSSVRISDTASAELRWHMLSGMLLGSIFLQYIVSVNHNCFLLNTVLPLAAARIIIKHLPSGSVFPVLLTGFLAYSATPGAYAAAERSIDILIAGIAAWSVSYLATVKKTPVETAFTEKPLPAEKVCIVSRTVICAVILYKILPVPQGIWIVLTAIFIYMVQKPEDRTINLVQQRIFSVPIGIFLGGLYSSAVVTFDYRFAYLAPLIGVVGFFMLYYKHDFFSFTLFFMFAFTVCADWLNGVGREINFLQLLFARSLATLIGTTVLLGIERVSANCFKQVQAT